MSFPFKKARNYNVKKLKLLKGKRVHADKVAIDPNPINK